MLLLNWVQQLFGTEGCTLVKSVQGFFFLISLEIWLLQVSLKSCEIIGRLCPPRTVGTDSLLQSELDFRRNAGFTSGKTSVIFL